MADLIASEPPVLFLDTASPIVRAGLQARMTPGACVWRETTDEASVGLFQIVEDLLREHSLRVDDLRTVVFCEGPGSLLGIRLAAIALRTWEVLPRPQPLRLLAYRSLELVAASLLEQPVGSPFVVVNDARRQTWNVLDVDANGAWTDLRRLSTAELPAHGKIFHPEEFPHWQELPDNTIEVDYRPAALPSLAQRYPLLRESASPDAFLVEMPTYRMWNSKSPSAKS